MNESIILEMILPYVKGGTITYGEFENIFSILSLHEQYDVIEILYKNGINLCDECTEEELAPDVGGSKNSDNLAVDTFDILYDDSIFKDRKKSASGFDTLVVNREITQSNEILCSLIQQGNRQAEQDLCVKNKRLVDKYVIAYEKKYGNRLDFEDLEQVGFIGLIKAAQRFSIQQGNAFSTYAVFWIKQSILREIMGNGYIIRIPVHMMERINKVAASDNRLIGKGVALHNRISEIAEELDLTEDNVRECLIFKKNYLLYSSLDVPVREESDSEVGEFVADEDAESVETIVMNSALREELEKILGTLELREQEIIKFRFGWDNGQAMTLEEVGSKYNITRERVRQIESKALMKLKLRRTKEIKAIRVFFEE